MLNELQDVIPTTPASDTEIQIIESRMVIGKTVNDLGLDTVIQQNYFPVIGKGLSRLMGNKPAQIAISRRKFRAASTNVPLSWKSPVRRLIP